MGLFEDNLSPYISFTEHVDPSNPSAGVQRLFVDTDHILKMVNSSGTVTTFGTSLADPMTTRGDMIVRNASNVTDRLGIGSSGKVLSSDGTDISWQTPSSGTTIAYPTLKSAVTDDFNAALSGWTAVSYGGSFAIGQCLGQAIDGSHLWMGYGGMGGYIYKSASNVDQEWIVGGMNIGNRITDMFWGIALMDSSGDGAAVIYHTDNTMALIPVAGGFYTGSGAQVMSSSLGSLVGTPGKIWLRLTRVTNTWDAYYSVDGVNWTHNVASTISVTKTISRKAIGHFNNTTGHNFLTADWVKTV
jgi:hypothetical protein